MTINYFTLINLTKEEIKLVKYCSYCRNEICDNEQLYLIKIASKDTDHDYILLNDSTKKCFICNVCYDCIDKNNGRILEVSNKFYNRFVLKNEKNIKNVYSLANEFSINEKRVSFVFTENCRARYTFGFLHFEPIRQINFDEQVFPEQRLDQEITFAASQTTPAAKLTATPEQPNEQISEDVEVNSLKQKYDKYKGFDLQEAIKYSTKNKDLASILKAKITKNRYQKESYEYKERSIKSK